MKTWFTLLALLCTVAAPALLDAQYALSAEQRRQLPFLRLPAQDNAALLAAETAARKPGRANKFAVALPVAARPSTNGRWTTEGNTDVWRLGVRSPGAQTLNLGFSEYHLPPGAELFLVGPDEKYGPFTAADNEDHNQLWTPLLEGDELIVELRVPAGQRKGVRLFLTAVNHDFQGVTKFLSGSCNLDVVCGAADGWGIVDGYRDIIRSVAAYTISGTDVCTGFLVNNTNQDGTPYFMTANHCGVGSGNAAALVAYWNFESDECRQPNSPESGQLGFGNRNTFNSGAIHLASYAPSDVTITMLDDDVNPAANAYFAGWDANAALPSDTTVAVHHPGVDEKRISFSFNQTYRVNNGGGTPVADGNLLEVPDWSIGTTEGGSSGSPIFDVDGYVRGQLFGGQAACGNDFYDVYGYFPVSWEGGGAPETRLKDWLDPCGTGTLRMEGMESMQVAFNLTADNYCNVLCGGTSVQNQLTAGAGYTDGGTISVINSPGVIEVSVLEGTVQAGETFTVTATAAPDAPTGDYAVVIGIDGDDGNGTVTLRYRVEAGLPAAPVELQPADGETSVSPLVSLSWTEESQAVTYDLELSTRSDFSAVTLARAGLSETELFVEQVLEPNRTYFWRVRSVNGCGTGEWASFSFTTQNRSCFPQEALDVPVTISSSGTPTVTSDLQSNVSGAVSDLEINLRIDHTFVGDLVGDLTSPEGTTIRLFEAVLGGNCGGSNMDVTFADDAPLSHEDFTNTCLQEAITTSGIFRPATALSTFAGESAAGEWTLTLMDQANFDGGAIAAFEITFCGAPTGADLSVESGISSLDLCQNAEVEIPFPTGADVDATPSVTVLADGQLLPSSISFAGDIQIATVTLDDFESLEPGTYKLDFLFVVADGVTRMVTIPLVLSGAGEAPEPTFPPDNALLEEEPLTFNWEGIAGTAAYNLQVATDEAFTDIVLNEDVDGLDYTWASPATGVLYWRVRATNGCGRFSGTVRSLTIETTGVTDLGEGRILSVYPNPVGRLLTIEATGQWSGPLAATLFNAAGRRITSLQITTGTRNEYPVGHLAAGVYYLRFTGAGQQWTERLVVVSR